MPAGMKRGSSLPGHSLAATCEAAPYRMPVRRSQRHAPILALGCGHHRRFICTCSDPKTGKQHGDIADIVRRCQPDGVDGSIASVAKWLRAAINRPVEAEPVARAAAGSQDTAKEAERAARSRAPSASGSRGDRSKAPAGELETAAALPPVHREKTDRALWRAPAGQYANHPGSELGWRRPQRATHLVERQKTKNGQGLPRRKHHR